MSLHAAQIDDKALTGSSQQRAILRARLDVELREVERNPADGEAWKAIAVIRTLLGMHHDAVTAFKRALELDAKMEGHFWLGMAVAANRSGRHEEALRAVEELTLLYPKEPVYWIFRAMSLENLGRPKEAKTALEQAAGLDATDQGKSLQALALGLLGRYDEALERDEQAIEALSRDTAIRSDRRKAHAWATKGMHLAKRGATGDADAAIEAFEYAIGLAPDDPWILHNYGVALGDLERYEDAQRFLEQALDKLEETLKKNEQDAGLKNRKGAVLRSLAFVLTKLGKHELALEHDTAAVAVAPHNPVHWRSKGVDLFHLGRYEEALHAFDVAADRAPGRADMWHAKGTALWKLGEYADATEAFERATSLDEGTADAWIGLGASLDALGRHRDALDALRKAVALAPERPELWPRLGGAYRGVGNAKAAEHAFRQGFALDHSMEMASGVVDALAAQDHEDDALEFLRKNVPRDADEALLAYWRGVLLARLGREDEAIAELGAAARRWAKDGVRDARATASSHALYVAERRGGGAASWVDHWFGRRSSPTTRMVGAVLLIGLLAALVVPLAATDKLGALEYGAGWAAITLPVTVLVLLLALPTVQSIKAGGGSFEITTVVLPDRDQLGLLPSDIRIEKIPDLPRLDAEAARNYSEHLNRLFGDLDLRGSPDVEAAGAARRKPGS
jgi:tetratricopeptide (TPR) repeat protein